MASLLPPRFVYLLALGLGASPLSVWAQRPDTQRGDATAAKLQSAPVEQSQFKLPPGFEIQLVASEPGINKPLNLTFDAQGRLWVTTTEMYPWPARKDARGELIASFDKNWEDNAIAFRAVTQPPKPRESATDTLYVLSDFGSDGRPRTIRTFAEGLNIPVGVMPLPRRPGAKGDTVLVYSIPAIWRLEDTDGDGKADVREKLYGDFGFKDTHGMSSNYTYWVDGWVYGTHGFANRSEIRDGSGGVTELLSGNTYRFRSDGSRFEVWANGQTNPFGLSFDPRGDVYTADSHSKPVYLLLPGGYYEGISKTHDGLGFAPAITQDNHGSTAIAGIAYYAARQFPEAYRGNLFNGNPVTRRVNRARLDWTGSTPQAVRVDDFLVSDDPSFRPVQVKLGPDGALWIADFYNPIIGHYEAPLTHPDRDRAHGRIWRIVWRGLDGEVPAPSLPVLPNDASGLARSLLSDNLVVRTLATNELVDRFGKAALPALEALKPDLNKPANAESVLPVLFAWERLGGASDAWLRALLTEPSTPEPAVVAALRVLAARTDLGRFDEAFFRSLIARTQPGHAWRQVAHLLTRHPGSWQAQVLLQMRESIPEKDSELLYSVRLALKRQMEGATLEELDRWRLAGGAQADRNLADVAVAVKTPAAGTFLLGYLERSSFADARSGEFARHAVTQLPTENFTVVETLIQKLAEAKMEPRLSLAEGLANVARLPGRQLSASVNAWMEKTLLTGIDDPDPILARRAIVATKDLFFPAKYPVLRAIGTDPDKVNSLRDAVVRNIGPEGPGTDILLEIVGTKGSVFLRKTAVDQIAYADPATLIRSSGRMAELLPGAASDLAMALTIALSRSDEGAEKLLQVIASGRAPATLLRHRYVATAFEARPVALQRRMEELTKNLPSEDARIDAIIAQRLGSYSQAKPDVVKGQQVFTQHCAVCHRVGSTGGNIGPSLDGVAAHDVNRLVEDILDPNRNVDPAFRLTTVTTTAGQTLSGMNKREVGDTLFLSDPSTGTDQSVPLATVASVASSPFSAMPAVFESAIPESDFFDLIAFLMKPAR